MTEIKLYKTTTEGLKIIGMCLPFVVIGVLLISIEPHGTTSNIAGWFCTCFFGLGILIGLFQAFDKRPQIIINENTIWDRTTKQGEIKWEQIIEAYPLEISGQKFIALVTDNTFTFEKKPYKWAVKLNKKIGAQKLNLHLGQINTDEIELTSLINELSKADKEERKKLIKSFKVNKANITVFDFKKIVLYVFISVGLLLLSLSGLVAFMTIMIIMGIAGLIARGYSGGNNKFRKYVELIVWFGIVNMILFVLTTMIIWS